MDDRTSPIPAEPADQASEAGQASEPPAEAPPPKLPPDSAGPGRPPLLRPRDDRVIAGVCAGLGRYADVDPVVFRVTLAVLTVFGGTGLRALPDRLAAHPGRGGARVGRRSRSRPPADSRPSVPALVGLGLALVVLAAIVSDSRTAAPALLLVGVIALLAYLARRRPTAPTAGPGWSAANSSPPTAPGWSAANPSPPTWRGGSPPPVPSAQTGADAGAAPYTGDTALYASRSPYWGATPAAYPLAEPATRRPREPRSVLGLVTVSTGLLLVGAVLLVASLTNTAVPARAAVAGALVVVGLGLVVGAWYGRSRGLIWLGALLAVVTLAVAAVDPAGGRRCGRPGLGAHEPVAVDRAYRLGAGEATRDLSRLPAADVGPVSAHVGVGRLLVLVPPDADVTVRGRAGFGNVRLFGDDRAGAGVDQRVRAAGPAATGLLNLDLRSASAKWR